MNPDYSIVGNTITMRMDYMDKLMERVSGFAADRAVEKYKEEKMRDEKLTAMEASKKLGVSKVTLIRYILKGKRTGGLVHRLKALKSGRDYIITRLDLEEFKEKLGV